MQIGSNDIESRTRKISPKRFGLALSLAIATTLSIGCLSRPTTSQTPTTKDTVTQPIRQSAIDKVDLLFDIDNSASMGDKQAYLSAAVPDLLTRLLSPYCVDTSQDVIQGSDGKPLRSDPNGSCAQGTPEFKPVHDLHIGVVTSSLGARGGDIAGCSSGDGDLKGELRDTGATSASGSPIADAGAGIVAAMAPSNFLSWFPNVDSNLGNSASSGAAAITDATTLESDFADVITGVGQDGCGIESQLESWYRFLIQPDPYDSIAVDSATNQASWQGIDATILKQRHDFLRPDSLVAVITLTDENDSEVDVRAISGSGYNFMVNEFQPPKGTQICDTDPNNKACTSCEYNPTDPGCPQGVKTVHSAVNDWGYNPNLRHVHAKAKYGVDFQFPIQRYVDGLTKAKIPNRDGEYPVGATQYQGNANCTNPLFAASLPDGSVLDSQTLCNLPIGSQRTPDLVFFGIIGGVPNQLLHYDGTDESLTLTAADWTKILGNDPETFDYTGIDPHMIEAYAPRPGLASPTSPNTADVINGREWITDTVGVGPNANPPGPMPFDVDREYACTFALAKPRDCTVETNQQACDCPSTNPGSAVPAGGIPPVCDAKNPTSQIAAKVYPTPRELLLAHKMADQGIAASLCPIDRVDNASGDDPKYGYRPAVAAIITRLKHALASTCLPQPLSPDLNGDVPCLILEALPPSSGSCASQGLTDADPKVAATYRATLTAESGTDGGASSTFTICEAPQLTGSDLDATGSCTSNTTKAGWCYVTGNAAGVGCAQAVKFSTKGNPAGGVRVQLQCILQTGGGDSNADAGSSN
jgi:hypothetical protein